LHSLLLDVFLWLSLLILNHYLHLFRPLFEKTQQVGMRSLTLRILINLSKLPFVLQFNFMVLIPLNFWKLNAFLYLKIWRLHCLMVLEGLSFLNWIFLGFILLLSFDVQVSVKNQIMLIYHFLRWMRFKQSISIYLIISYLVGHNIFILSSSCHLTSVGVWIILGGFQEFLNFTLDFFDACFFSEFNVTHIWSFSLLWNVFWGFNLLNLEWFKIGSIFVLNDHYFNFY